MKKRFAASAMILAMSAATVLSPLTTFAEAEEQELNIAIFQGGYGDAYWNQMVELFEASHEGVKVNMTISPTIGDIIRPQIVAGNAPDFICLNDGGEDPIRPLPFPSAGDRWFRACCFWSFWAFSPYLNHLRKFRYLL